MLAVGQGSGVAGLGFLTVACLAQVADITSTDGLTRGSVAATYQAMPPQRRLPAQTLAEGAGTPVAIGLVGAVLLLFQAVGLDVLRVVWLVLVPASSGSPCRSSRTGPTEATSRTSSGTAPGTLVPCASTARKPRRWSVSSWRAQKPSARTTGLEALADSRLPGPGRRAGTGRSATRSEGRTRALAPRRCTGTALAGRPSLRDGLIETLGPTPEGVTGGGPPHRSRLGRRLARPRSVDRRARQCRRRPWWRRPSPGPPSRHTPPGGPPARRRGESRAPRKNIELAAHADLLGPR